MYECNSTVAFWRPGPNSASLEFLFSSNGSPEYNPMLLFFKKKYYGIPISFVSSFSSVDWKILFTFSWKSLRKESSALAHLNLIRRCKSFECGISLPKGHNSSAPFPKSFAHSYCLTCLCCSSQSDVYVCATLTWGMIVCWYQAWLDANKASNCNTVPWMIWYDVMREPRGMGPSSALWPWCQRTAPGLLNGCL